MKKWLLIPVVMLVLFFLYRQHHIANPVIRIGVLHSLTGTMAGSEAPLVDAVRLAVEETNQSGGIHGAKIQMIVSDCRSDANYCAAQAEKLISQDKVDALFGCWTSACRKAVKNVVEKHHHLLFYPLQYEGFEQSRDIFYTGAVPNQQIIPMVAWAMQTRGRRAYLIGSDYIFPHVANQIIRKLLFAKSGEVAGERYVPLGSHDFDQVAKEIASVHPDFVLNTLNGDSNRHFFLALQKAGISASDIPVFSSSIAEAELSSMPPGLMTGHYAAWNYFESVKSTENRAFIENFHRRFGQQRVVDDPMEAAYIGVHLWVNAMREAGSSNISAIKGELEKQAMNAPEGIVAVDADTHHLWKMVRIGRIRPDGQFDIVWQSGRSIGPRPFPFFISRADREKIESEYK